MEDKRIVRSSNSHTLRTQKILSNKKVITAILILEDFLLLAVWNILLNFFGNLITTLKFHQSIDHQHMIQVWFYTGPGAWKFYIIFVIFVAAFDALQAYHIYTSFSEKDINVGQRERSVGLQQKKLSSSTKKSRTEIFHTTEIRESSFPG